MKLLKKSIAALFVFSVSFSAVSQAPLREFLQGGKEDARTLTDAYLQPYGEMLGTSLNSGWYNSAKVHGILGFDVTFSIMNSVAPSAAKTFDVNALALDNFIVEGASPGDVELAPTVAGDMDDRPVLQPDSEGGKYARFTMPNGSGTDNLPLPMLQAAVGLPKDIELIGRVVPKMKFSDAGEVSLLGFGVKHSLKNYIPVVKRLPFLQMSLLAGYTSFNSATPVPGTPDIEVTDGELAISSGAFTSRLLIGANFPVVAIYTGLGYGSSNSDFDVKGEYAIDGFNEPFSDPFTLGYKTSGVDFNAGMRIRVGFLALHADYTVGKYSTLTAGLGINIR